MIDTSALTISGIAKHLRQKDFSCKELVQAYLDNAKSKNKELNAYLEFFEDNIPGYISFAEKKLNDGSNSFLAGVPMAIKDNIMIDGKICSCSSKILENYKATFDSTVAKRLKESGVVILGRTNMDEFAMGSSTENSAFGVTKNPHDTSRVPGGSSGGSAVSVAASMSVFALGSETGGSIRQPASHCGVVGLKTTYGSVSRHGLIAMGSSLDQIGPITKSVEDAELVFNAISGFDPMDSTSVPDNLRKKGEIPVKLKIGIPRSFLSQGVDADVMSNFENIIDGLRNMGHEIVDIDIPSIKYSLAVYYIIMPAEVSTNLARFDGVRYGLHVDGKDLLEDYLKTRKAGFGPEPRRRIILGTYILSSGYYDAYYKKATEVRKMLKQEMKSVFVDQKVDAIAMPTTPSPAFKIGEKTSDPLSMYLEDIFTVTANVVGVPALSVPSGTVLRDGVGLPTGFQIMSNHFREDLLFKIGKDIERLQGKIL